MLKEVVEQEKYIRWFSSLSFKDVSLVGGKAANLGEMYNLGLPVPQGFAITAQSYNYFLEATGIKEQIYEILEGIDIEDNDELNKVCDKIKAIIINAKIPQDMQKEITEAYELFNFNESDYSQVNSNVLKFLKTTKEGAFVAVRSSATAEDSAEASFAGQQETYLNVKGKDAVLESVKKCFASLFSPRSVYYRVKKGFKHETVLIAVVIQIMVNSDKSGVVFSRDPVNDPENVVIESVFGLGEGIVSGMIEPDHYIVSRELKIISKKLGKKNVAITRNSEGKNAVVKLTEERSTQQVLTDPEIRKLAEYSMKLEQHYKKPQDSEFAVSSGEIFIVQTRPITTLGKKTEKINLDEGKVLLSGLAASPGIGFGEVRIVHDLAELNKVRKGDILVTEMTNPDMVVSMQKAAGIVTDEGGSTCHAAIVSREMGIPAVVGTKEATKKLHDGQQITVDGFSGKVYDGKIEELKAKQVEIFPIVETKTKIKVIVDLPDYAERAARTKCKQVGLTRIEGIIAESGKHPFYFIKNKNIEKYEEIIYHGINKIAEYFDEVWVRTSDIRSDEYRHLDGAPKQVELNPMLGMHGIRAGLKYKEIITAEIKALMSINKKVGLMMPQIISVEEVQEVKKILKELNADLTLGIMVETPAAVQVIEEMCKEGIKFISFGTNDLTQFTLAIDRGNEEVQYLYDETHPAVLRQIKHVIEVCKKYNVETSICGQAGSNEKMVAHLVEYGIDSISVNADKAGEISKFVQNLESKHKTANVNVKDIKEVKVEEKKMHQVPCTLCSRVTEVPFVPDGIRPVFCKFCMAMKKEDREKALSEKNKVKESFNVKEEKEIDKIIQESEKEAESDDLYVPQSKEIISEETLDIF